MIFRTNPHSGVPLYLQLIEQVRHGVETGALRPNDQLPGIRNLSEELVINPNTVAKAYREMEHEGLIALRHGAGAFIAEQRHAKPLEVMQRGRAVIRGAMASLHELGLNEGEIRRLVESELAEANGKESKR
jgi:GntR family transcriptional regulator